MAWQRFDEQSARMKSQSLIELFEATADRYQQFSMRCGAISLDYSKNHIDTQAMDALMHLAQAANVPASIAAMFSGNKINNTEGRAVGHVALRATKHQQFVVDGVDQIPAVLAQRTLCYQFAQAVRSGAWLGETGKRITDVVNIGTGGSDLGARMTIMALKQYESRDVNLHFVSNIDGHDLFEKLAHLSVDTTLFIISSKTFRTQETMTNAAKAKAWFLEIGRAHV